MAKTPICDNRCCYLGHFPSSGLLPTSKPRHDWLYRDSLFNPGDYRGCGKSHMPMPSAGYAGHTSSPGVSPHAPEIEEAPSPPYGASSWRELVRISSRPKPNLLLA